jgi:hypothetical protein
MPIQTPWSNLLNLLRPKLLGRRDGRYVIASLIVPKHLFIGFALKMLALSL